MLCKDKDTVVLLSSFRMFKIEPCSRHLRVSYQCSKLLHILVAFASFVRKWHRTCSDRQFVTSGSTTWFKLVDQLMVAPIDGSRSCT